MLHWKKKAIAADVPKQANSDLDLLIFAAGCDRFAHQVDRQLAVCWSLPEN